MGEELGRKCQLQLQRKKCFFFILPYWVHISIKKSALQVRCTVPVRSLLLISCLLFAPYWAETEIQSLLDNCTYVQKEKNVDLHGLRRREIITIRGQSYVSRLPKYWPPPTSPPGNKGVGYTLAGRRGGWGVNILEDERHRIALLQ